MNSQITIKNLFIFVAIIAVVGLACLMAWPDHRTPTEKLGDAIHELPQGVGQASQELKDDRTPGQKLGDAFRDTGDKIKENSNPN